MDSDTDRGHTQAVPPPQGPGVTLGTLPESPWLL